MNDVRDYMITEPALCTYLTSIDNIKKLMSEKGVNEVVVVDTFLEKHFMGIIRQDDIIKKAHDLGVEPSMLSAEQCIRPVLTTAPFTSSMQECYKLMDYNQIKNLVIVDEEKHVCGVLPLLERAGEI